jgi:hypothetical protein
LKTTLPQTLVECEVRRGGNSIATKMIFEVCQSDKSVILFDTLAGMTEPEEHDRSSGDGKAAEAEYIASVKSNHNEWCYASLEDVKQNFSMAGID